MRTLDTMKLAGDDHGVILIDRIDASKVFIYECYGRETSW